MDASNNPSLRIKKTTAISMVVVALIYDGTQAFIDIISFGFLGWIFNPIINVWSLMTFLFWFSLKGVSFIHPKKALLLGGVSTVELIPFINSLPTWTAGVIILIAQTYSEDMIRGTSKTGLKTIGGSLSKLK